MEENSPRTVINNLLASAEKISDINVQTNMIEAAKSIEYLLVLLRECESYIRGVSEYPEPPRFLLAVQQMLGE